MKTKKVLNYRNVKIMTPKGIYLAILVEILKDFKVIKEKDDGFYGQLSNLHFDLNRSNIQNRNKYNENRSTLTEG